MLRRRVGHAHDDWVLLHGADHVLRDGTGDGDADEDVSIFDDIGELALLVLRVRDLGDVILVGVHVFLTTLVDGAHAVAEDDVAAAHAVNQARDGLAGSAGTVEDEL